MGFGRRLALALALAAGAGVLWTPPEASAEESGSFSLIATYVRDYTTLEHATGTFFGGTLQGTSTVLTSSGGPFVEGEHSLVTCLVYGKRSASGVVLETACTVTNASGEEKLPSLRSKRLAELLRTWRKRARCWAYCEK